ncbi:MAG: threonine--tRNA ligase [Dehalococcoidia bacterium]|nr:threonine--tRNA ligase [Dehalococcoidia bacterium]
MTTATQPFPEQKEATLPDEPRADFEEHQGDRLAPQRHSAAHVMAEAVMALFPGAKLGIGPVIEDGFYYDFDLPRALTPEDLPAIEGRMREIMAADAPFQRRETSQAEAGELFKEQPYKLELIRELGDTPLSLYTHHGWTDLCRGPHVASTGKIGRFKLLSIAGAYWRGSETRPMLQRIYGTCFPTQVELDAHLQRLEEAERRDHRRLGRELGLFFFDPIAPASPFFLPKGAAVYNLMVAFMRELYQRYSYQEVITPQVFSSDLWKRSGHYDNYRDNMYFINVEEREYGVKPMNCPAACVVYATQLRSYRELPLRYADFGRLHRYERSGVTHGLTRVRSFTQDDAHIYCRPDQVQGEVASIFKMVRETYEAFGLGEPRVTLSLRPEKRGGSEEMWDRAEPILRDALRASGYAFEEVPGEGAFYGPKVDLFMRDAIGREWQLGTTQLDLFMPERFDLGYIAEDGSAQRPVMIHRAILGSLERFLGVLIEHHAGAFPFWLAPVQAVVIPITDSHVDYGQQVKERLAAAGLRAELDAGNERMNAKVRRGELQKVPYLLIVGDREAAAGTVSVRSRGGPQEQGVALSDFIARAQEQVQTKAAPATKPG